MLKKRENGEASFHPIVSVCAFVEAAKKIRTLDEKAEIIARFTLGDLLDTELSPDGMDYFRDFNEYVKPQTSSVTLEKLMLFVFAKEFLRRLNKSCDSRDCASNFSHIKKSATLISCDLIIPFSQQSQDPFSAYITGKSTGAYGLVEYMLDLLCGYEYDMNQARFDPGALVPEILAERMRLVEKIIIHGYTAYVLPTREVTLSDFADTKEALNELCDCDLDEINYNYRLASPRGAASWRILLFSFITSQQLLFTLYNAMLSSLSRHEKSEKSQTERLKMYTEEGIQDFEEYYDIDVIAYARHFFKAEYEMLKKVNRINEFYNTLKEKRELLNSDIAEEQRSTLNRTMQATESLFRSHRLLLRIEIGLLIVTIASVLILLLSRVFPMP